MILKRKRMRRNSSGSFVAVPSRDSSPLGTTLFVFLCSVLARQASSFTIAATDCKNHRLPNNERVSVAKRSGPRHSALRLFSATTSTVTLSHTDFSISHTTGAQPVSLSSSDATPVIFLHGLLGSKRNFASIAASLSQQLSTHRRRRIVGVDLRNHGDTSSSVEQHRGSMDYKDMAADVLDFMDQQRMERAVLVGHSMGGKVAQACALLQPERVDGLVVLDIAPVSYSSEDAHWKAVHDIIHTMCQVPVGSGVTKTQVDQYLRSAIPDPALRAFVLTNMQVRNGACQWKIPIETIADQLDRLAAFDIPTHHQYQGDVFFIHGGQSRFVKSSYLGRIAEYFPNHLLTTIRGAGHWLHAEAPDDTTALLKRYLER